MKICFYIFLDWNISHLVKQNPLSVNSSQEMRIIYRNAKFRVYYFYRDLLFPMHPMGFAFFVQNLSYG